MLGFELEWERSFADFTFEARPLVSADACILKFSHLGVDPVPQTRQMDIFDSTTARATLEKWIFSRIFFIPTESASISFVLCLHR